MVSNFIYFAFIPVAIWLAMYVIIETREKIFHRYTLKKNQYYLWGMIIATILVIVIVILALLI